MSRAGLFGLLGLTLLLTNGLQYVAWSWYAARIEAQNTRLDDRINNPTSGLVRQLAQCATNGEGVTIGLVRLSGQIKDLAKATTDGDIALMKALAAPTKAAVDARNAANELLSRPREAPMIGTLEACMAGERALRGTQK